MLNFIADLSFRSLAMYGVATALVLRVVYGRIAAYRLRAKLPPTPPGIPFFGNLFQLTDEPWKVFANWSRTHGQFIDVLSLSHKIHTQLA